MNQKNAMATTKDRVNEVRGLLEKMKGQLVAALPKHVSPDRLVRIVLTSIQRTPKLLECTRESLLGSILQSAQLGLEPDGVLGEAYLIPYWNGRKRAMECQFQSGYKGLIKLARQSGQISTIAARVVKAGDAFAYSYGLDEKLEHVPRAEAEQQVTHVYAVAKLKDGGYQFEVMTTGEIESVHQRTQGYQRAADKGAAEVGPWVTDWEAMAKKTVLRRLCKLLPSSVEMARAVALDGLAEAGVPQEIDFTIDGQADDDPGDEEPQGEPDSLDALVDAEQGELPVQTQAAPPQAKQQPVRVVAQPAQRTVRR